jgi:hypothetical protein
MSQQLCRHLPEESTAYLQYKVLAKDNMAQALRHEYGLSVA